MKFATVDLDGRGHVALVDDGQGVFWLVSDLLPEASAAAADMTDLIAHYPELRARLAPRGEGRPLADARLRAPLPRPPHNIMCVGKNYYAHAREFASSGFDASAGAGAEAVPDLPIVFTKPSSAISATGAPIPLVAGLDQAVDYEVELAVVIGAGGRGISRAAAMDHVFGYTIVNDVTARDLQHRHKQWFLGKGIDGFCPMGPWIVTADEIDGGDLDVSCRVNGELRQEATTRDLIFDIPTLIEVISASMTLSPGDIIATGTPAGVGIGFDPPRFLHEGDVVECAIGGIGKLVNRVERVGNAAAPRPDALAGAGAAR